MECREFCVKEDAPADAAGEVDNHLRIARSPIRATETFTRLDIASDGTQGGFAPVGIAGKRL